MAAWGGCPLSVSRKVENPSRSTKKRNKLKSTQTSKTVRALLESQNGTVNMRTLEDNRKQDKSQKNWCSAEAEYKQLKCTQASETVRALKDEQAR